MVKTDFLAPLFSWRVLSESDGMLCVMSRLGWVESSHVWLYSASSEICVDETRRGNQSLIGLVVTGFDVSELVIFFSACTSNYTE